MSAQYTRILSKPKHTTDEAWLFIVRCVVATGWVNIRETMTSEQRALRMHIRNAYLAESNVDIDTAIAYRMTKQDWFAIACLCELQLTP